MSKTKTTTEEVKPNPLPPDDQQSTAQPNFGIATTEQIGAEQLLAADQAFQENVDESEMRMTRLSICQGTTKEIANGIDGYKLGQIISSITREVLSTHGPAPWLLAKGVSNPAAVHHLAVIPVMKLPTEYLEWVPKNEQKEGESPIRQKTLNKDEHWVKTGIYVTKGGKWGSLPEHKNLPPPITDNLNYLFLPVRLDLKEPKKSEIIEGFAIGTFAKTSNQTGNQLSNLIQNMRAKRFFPWDTLYYLYTQPKQTKKGITQIYQVAYGGLVKNMAPELVSMAMAMAVQMSNPENGRLLQERILNAAELTPDHDESSAPGGGSDDDNTLDSVAGAGTQADDAFGDGSKQGF